MPDSKTPKISGARILGMGNPAFLLALAGLLALLVASWIFLRPDKNFDEQLHGQLQEKTQSSIAGYVEKNHPEISKITFHKIWTKNTKNQGKIEVFFQYSLSVEEEEAGGEVVIDGQASLTQAEANPAHWILHNFQVTNSSVDFSEPLLIKASAPSQSDGGPPAEERASAAGGAAPSGEGEAAPADSPLEGEISAAKDDNSPPPEEAAAAPADSSL